MTWLRSTSDIISKQRVEGGVGESNCNELREVEKESKTRWNKMGKDGLENSLEERSNKL